MTHRHSPSRDDACRILTEVIGGTIEYIQRFTTGLAHYVYDARLDDGRRFVVRLTPPEQAVEFAGALYWYERLKPLGIPLPDLFYEDVRGTRHGVPVMIMERLPGTDLGHVYDGLTDSQKREISAWVVELQKRTATLPLATGFGYALSYDDPELLPTWQDVLLGSLDRSRRYIESAGVVDVEVVDRVASRLDDFGGYLSQIEPVPFLHDTTTKNVIIGDGDPTGIVDVDSLCFGDPLWTLSLTRMALLAHGHDTAYIDHWEHHLDLTAEQHRASLLYTAIHCTAFLSELGQAFNNESAPPVDADYRWHLLMVLDRLIA
ncbi:MAG: phosphotransferase [Thermomicrobiales bacterium]